MIKYTKPRTLLLFLLVLAFSVFRGTARKDVKTPKKVVTIYLTKNIGDVIFTTPVFRALKARYPTCHISFVGRPKNKETLAYNTDIDEYIVCPNSLFGLWKVLWQLKADYAFLFTTSSLELSLLYLANIPSIGVFSVQNISRHTRSYEILKKFCIQVPFYSGQNFAMQNLKLLSPLGIHSEDTTKHLFYSPEGGQEMRKFLEQEGIFVSKDIVIALAPGAGTKIKQWPADRFAKLADHLSEKHGVPIFVVGGPGDKKEFEEMQASVSSKTKIVSGLDQSIDELKAFMSYVDVMVANDSAPIYIAEAFGKATVTIVGPTDENEHPPSGDYHRVVKWAGKGAPSLPSMTSIDYSEEKAREQIEAISVDQVVSTLDELIPKVKMRAK